jgi:thiamine-phosphate pyrophosphorylase
MAQSTPIVDTALSVDTPLARIRGYYAILDRDDEALARRLVAPAMEGGAGATVLQVRLKPATTRQILEAARMARRVTRAAGALLIVNDRVDMALAVEADGVHVGQDDLPLADALGALGTRRPAMLVGVSTHDLFQVRAAVAGGADYLGFGPVFGTVTKVNPDPVVGLEGLAAAVAAAGTVPVVAIGGIGAEQAGTVAATGAAALCAIAAVTTAADPGAAGRALGAPWVVG